MVCPENSQYQKFFDSMGLIGKQWLVWEYFLSHQQRGNAVSDVINLQPTPKRELCSCKYEAHWDSCVP